MERHGFNDARILRALHYRRGRGLWKTAPQWRKEAYLRFPDIYRRIQELEADSPHHPKKEQPVLASRLARAGNLQAAAHSHAMHDIDVKGPGHVRSGKE